MEKAISFLEKLVTGVGKATSWITILLVLIIVGDVFMRYTFGITSSASFEIEWDLFGALFLLGAGWTFIEDKHVRVDVFYQKFSRKGQAWVNLIGTVVFLMPFCYVIFVKSVEFVMTSFHIHEISPDPGGLPARFLIKAMIPAGILVLGLQGIAAILRSTKDLLEND